MLNRVMPTCFQNVIEAYHVGLDIRIRICDGIAHSSLCSKIDHNRRVVFLEDFLDGSLITQVTLDESKPVILQLL